LSLDSVIVHIANSSNNNNNRYGDETFVFTNCLFKDNTAGYYGGAMGVQGINVILIGCAFEGNTAGTGGDDIDNYRVNDFESSHGSVTVWGCVEGSAAGIRGIALDIASNPAIGLPFSYTCDDACEGGQYAASDPSTDETTCTDCLAGYVSDGSAWSSCTPCGFGQYTSTAGSFRCSFCQDGKSTTATASRSINNCVYCEAVRFSVSGGPCKDCEQGKWTDVVGASTCTR